MITRALIAAVSLLALTSCGTTAGDNTDPETGVTDLNPDCPNCTDEITAVTARLPHGGTVDCLVLDGFRELSLSCDWDHAKRSDPTKEGDRG